MNVVRLSIVALVVTVGMSWPLGTPAHAQDMPPCDAAHDGVVWTDDLGISWECRLVSGVWTWVWVFGGTSATTTVYSGPYVVLRLATGLNAAHREAGVALTSKLSDGAGNWYRSAGDLRVTLSIQRYNGSAWTTCQSALTSYNGARAAAVTVNRTVNAGGCGSGYYRTYSSGFAWNDAGSAFGGYSTGNSIYVTSPV